MYKKFASKDYEEKELDFRFTSGVNIMVQHIGAKMNKFNLDFLLASLNAYYYTFDYR